MDLYGTAKSLPEPGILFLMTLGLAAMALVSGPLATRRRKQLVKVRNL